MGIRGLVLIGALVGLSTAAGNLRCIVSWIGNSFGGKGGSFRTWSARFPGWLCHP